MKVLATERQVPFKGLTRQKVLDDLKANGWLPDDRPPPQIKQSAARNYLHWLGFHQAVCGKGVFVDGHDRPDVVLYRPEFCAKYMEYYRQGPNWYKMPGSDEYVDKDKIDDVTEFNKEMYMGLGGMIHPDAIERARCSPPHQFPSFSLSLSVLSFD